MQKTGDKDKTPHTFTHSTNLMNKFLSLVSQDSFRGTKTIIKLHDTSCYTLSCFGGQGKCFCPLGEVVHHYTYVDAACLCLGHFSNNVHSHKFKWFVNLNQEEQKKKTVLTLKYYHTLLSITKCKLPRIKHKY